MRPEAIEESMTSHDIALLDFARVLSDATRQRIMQQCCCCWCNVGEIVESLGGDVSQPTVSHHLGVLREAGLVQSRREGRQIFYTLDQAKVASCCGQLLVSLAPETAAAEAVRQAKD
jgi:DNA-binding transcriptional ArsR family regulator